MTLGYMLYYHYKSVCPRCKTECDHYIQLHNFRPDCDTNIMCNGKCKCGYVGLVDIKYVGRVMKYGKRPINPDLIDPH